MALRKRKYLNNRDLLKEIHKSKNSYCSYLDNNDAQYDIILNSVDRINRNTISQARKNRAERIAKARWESAQLAGKKCKLDEFTFDHRKIEKTDLVFRIMTFDHIPEEPGRKKNPKNTQDYYVKLNFPPFQHYKLNDADEPYCVGKSHWKGGLHNGHFSKDHGSMTNELARMFMKMCERYGSKWNWRGYCVDEDTEALTQRGWLKYNEINTNDKILSYDGKQMVWSNIKSVYINDYNGKMFKLSSRGIDSLVTPGHKIVTEHGLTRIEYLLESDKVVLIGDKISTDFEKTWSDSFVELIGWIVTEGNFQPKKKQITVYQNEGAYADRIRKCLNNLSYEFHERKSKKSNCISFSIKRKHWNDICKAVPEKNLNMSFILSLTSSQQELLIETMIDGDGHRNGLLKRYTQKNKEHMDLFQALCALNGQKVNIKYVENKMSFGKPVNYYTATVFSPRGNNTRGSSIVLHGGKNNGKKHIGKGKIHHPNQPTENYQGKVWCPKTDYGTFFARRNGKAYLTGNTYNDEMRSQALVQLSQVGLQFDESKSQNPFAYYTATITNSFTRVLNTEKKNQNIRDDMLEINGYDPSNSRQLDNELHWKDTK